MAASQEYPRSFGHYVAQLHSEYMSDETWFCTLVSAVAVGGSSSILECWVFCTKVSCQARILFTTIHTTKDMLQGPNIASLVNDGGYQETNHVYIR